MVATGVPAAGRSSRLSGPSAAAKQRLDVGDPSLVPAARLPDVLPPAVRVGDVSSGVEDRLVVGL